MAITVRKTTDAMIFAMASAFDAWKREVAAGLASYPHADITSVMTDTDYRNPTSTPLVVITTTANSLPTVKSVGNDCKRVFNLHCADAVAHQNADDTNLFTTANLVTADDQTATDAWLNDLKAAVNAHFVEADVHYNDDVTNTIVANDASTLGESETLVDAIRTALNAHISFGFASPSLNLIDP